MGDDGLALEDIGALYRMEEGSETRKEIWTEKGEMETAPLLRAAFS